MRAVKTIADEAGIHIGIKRFAVINQVAAVALNATIDCDAFADAHSSDSHYDKKSFVGLAVCLCYSTVPLTSFSSLIYQCRGIAFDCA
jgi:TATA-box binding protein (TBP) (component of TFIID and TFIIIB)